MRLRSVQCLSDGDCGSNSLCIFGACVPKAGNGVPCVSVRSACRHPELCCQFLAAKRNCMYHARMVTRGEGAWTYYVAAHTICLGG